MLNDATKRGSSCYRNKDTAIHVIFAHYTFLFFPTTLDELAREERDRLKELLRFYSHAHSYIFIYAICKISLQGRISYRYSSPTSVCNAISLPLSYLLYISNYVKCIYLSRMYVLHVGHCVRTHTDHTIFTTSYQVIEKRVEVYPR